MLLFRFAHSLARFLATKPPNRTRRKDVGKRHGSNSEAAEHEGKKQHETKTNFKLNLFANFPRDVSKNLSEMRCVVVWMKTTTKTHSGDEAF